MTIEFGKSGQEAEAINVPALVIDVDSASIRDYLALSEKLPVLVLFTGAEDPASGELRKALDTLTQKAAGRLITLVVDAALSPELAQAFELAAVPSAFALLKGQPAPLFTGNQPVEQLQMVINRVLEVAAENQLTGQVSVASAEQTPELSETHKLAFDAIDRADYQSALALYEKAILENPNDQLAEAGLAQVKLLIRLEGKDVAGISNSEALDRDSVMQRADALIATNRAEEGFDLLLQLFGSLAKDEREPVRLRLVELFLVVGVDALSVAEARKKLSLLLF